MTRGPLRLFLDSNVLTGGLVAPWGLDKAVLSLCAARICRLVLAEIVRQEVEDMLGGGESGDPARRTIIGELTKRVTSERSGRP